MGVFIFMKEINIIDLTIYKSKLKKEGFYV